ncbi:MAG: hypothetical protein R3A11_04770 [Bdellovibrionota bacterium]
MFFASSIQYQTFRSVLKRVLKEHYNMDSMISFESVYGDQGISALNALIFQELSTHPSFAWLNSFLHDRGLTDIQYEDSFQGSQSRELEDIVRNESYILEIIFSRPQREETPSSRNIPYATALQREGFSAQIFLDLPRVDSRNNVRLCCS